ncbi:MAG: DUF951 domain-containing protein [Oscillospiraceae bacterium]|jgi:hypothetical protein|nr:DUF951 domain-containing protein [Oscillospiraceae bacterium]
MDIAVGDILTMKKKHPCGGFEWLVTRVGADFKMKCLCCGHEIMRPRAVIERRVKAVRRDAGP